MGSVWWKEKWICTEACPKCQNRGLGHEKNSGNILLRLLDSLSSLNLEVSIILRFPGVLWCSSLSTWVSEVQSNSITGLCKFPNRHKVIWTRKFSTETSNNRLGNSTMWLSAFLWDCLLKLVVLLNHKLFKNVFVILWSCNLHNKLQFTHKKRLFRYMTFAVTTLCKLWN